MQLLSTFEPLGSPSSSAIDAAYPLTNIAITVLDPFLQCRWASYDEVGGEYLIIDRGAGAAGVAVNAFFFNRCNFPHAHIQGNASNTWGAPSFDEGKDLVMDECDNRKGYFVPVAAFTYRYVRILIPLAQTLDAGYGSCPAIGNLLFGTAVELPAVVDFNANVDRRTEAMQMDGGPEYVRALQRARYSINGTCEGTRTSIKAIKKNWTMGVLYDGFDVEGSWLIWNSESWGRPYQSGNDTQVSFAFKERP